MQRKSKWYPMPSKLTPQFIASAMEIESGKEVTQFIRQAVREATITPLDSAEVLREWLLVHKGLAMGEDYWKPSSYYQQKDLADYARRIDL